MCNYNISNVRGKKKVCQIPARYKKLGIMRLAACSTMKIV